MIGLSFRSGRDVPLAHDASNRFLPWIIGAMVLLAALALATAMVLSTASRAWRAQLVGTLTVQLLPRGDGGPTDDLDARVARAIALLRAQPGVVKVTELPQAEIATLLEPWLGPTAAQEGLPMPRMIDVTLRPDAAVDTTALASRLTEAVPGAQLDDHAAWLQRLLSLAGAIEALAAAVLALIGLTATATVVFTTRASLAIHDGTIELLHLVGAEDGYIARQFQIHALGLALRGGVAGLVVAVAMLYAVIAAAPDPVAGLLPDMSLSVGQWVALVLLPLAAALIATVTARMTVLRSLTRID